MLIILLVLIMINKSSNSPTVVINRYDDSECDLDPKLIEEIASYNNVTKYIMDEIINRSGATMYEQYTEFIDKFGARPSGSEVLEYAIDHMVKLTTDNGLQDVTTEELDDIYIGSSVSTPPEGITAEVIVVTSFQELDNIVNANVEGKIVVYDVPFKSYGETVIYRSQGATRAAMKGAVASLVRSITPFSLYTPHTGAQYYGENVTRIPAAAITVEDADLLKRLQDEGQKIILNIKMVSKFDMKKSRNTIIDLRGRQHPEKLVIVSGHIDSWDVGQGAMDDGGGMMISWFTPVILNQLKLKPRRTLRAILWTSEEPGLIGAAEYLKKHNKELTDINFIMESDEGTFKPLGLEVAGTKPAHCIIAEILKNFSPIDKLEKSDSPGSDIVMFVRKGVPGASLLNENDRYYWFHHTEADTMNVQNRTDVISCAAFWAAVSYVIADLSVDIPR